jgi:hypothetical protein
MEKAQEYNNLPSWSGPKNYGAPCGAEHPLVMDCVPEAFSI